MSKNSLIPLNERSEEERRAIATAGGLARGKQMKERKKLREWLEQALSVVMHDRQGEVILSPDTGEPLTRAEAATLKLVDLASRGDIRAYEVVARMLGEWVDKQAVTIDATISAEVRSVSDAATWLYNDYSPTYQRFFFDNRDSRHVLLQGGRRSGKTQATIRHLLRLTDAMNEQLKVLVVCYQHPQLLKTIEDFTSITGVVPHADQCQVGRVLWQFANFDEYTKAQGSQCDFLFINEAVNLPEDIGDVLTLGTRLQCYYNFNPTKASWVQKLVSADGANLLCTTFKDNAYLPPEQVAEFETMKQRALRPNSTMHDRYMYEVYYLGNFATMVGAVFSNLETTADYEQVAAQEYYGMDFGFATDGDPTTLVGVKIHGRKIYVRQYIYEQGLTREEDIVARMEQAGLNKHTPIFADYGGQGRGRIQRLIALGWSVMNCKKTGVIDGLSQLLMYDAIVIDEASEATRSEFESMELDKNQQPRGADHAIDAVRYAFQEAKRRESV